MLLYCLLHRFLTCLLQQNSSARLLPTCTGSLLVPLASCNLLFTMNRRLSEYMGCVFLSTVVDRHFDTKQKSSRYVLSHTYICLLGQGKPERRSNSKCVPVLQHMQSYSVAINRSLTVSKFQQSTRLYSCCMFAGTYAEYTPLFQ